MEEIVALLTAAVCSLQAGTTAGGSVDSSGNNGGDAGCGRGTLLVSSTYTSVRCSTAASSAASAENTAVCSCCGGPLRMRRPASQDVRRWIGGERRRGTTAPCDALADAAHHAVRLASPEPASISQGPSELQQQRRASSRVPFRSCTYSYRTSSSDRRSPLLIIISAGTPPPPQRRPPTRTKKAKQQQRREIGAHEQ